MRHIQSKSDRPINGMPKIKAGFQSDNARPALPNMEIKEDFSAVMKGCFGRRSELTEEERRSLGDLRTKIQMYNRAVPNLRLGIPEFNVSLNLEICAEYYFQVGHARLEENAPEKVAALLTSFQQEHEQEWHYCGWKNDTIADLMLGNFGYMSTAAARREAADVWLKQYRKRDQKMARETDLYLSPPRMAASAAVFDLEMLVSMDEIRCPWIRPGYKRYVSLVGWLNRNWPDLAGRKRGQALRQEVLTRFRRNHTPNELSDSDLAEVCDVYGSIESSYPQGDVPPSQVILVLVARQHKVSPRLVSTVRAEEKKRRMDTYGKAGS